jgi:hypothetical protein
VTAGAVITVIAGAGCGTWAYRIKNKQSAARGGEGRGRANGNNVGLAMGGGPNEKKHAFAPAMSERSGAAVALFHSRGRGLRRLGLRASRAHARPGEALLRGPLRAGSVSWRSGGALRADLCASEEILGLRASGADATGRGPRRASAASTAASTTAAAAAASTAVAPAAVAPAAAAATTSDATLPSALLPGRPRGGRRRGGFRGSGDGDDGNSLAFVGTRPRLRSLMAGRCLRRPPPRRLRPCRTRSPLRKLHGFQRGIIDFSLLYFSLHQPQLIYVTWLGGLEGPPGPRGRPLATVSTT